jgi:hypothetical protein
MNRTYVTRALAMFRLCAMCVLLVAGTASSVAADVKLEWKFKEGETFYVENETKTKQTIGTGAAPVGLEKTTTTVAQYKVIRTTSEETVLEMQFAGFKGDAKDPIAAIAGAFAKDFKEITFRITLNMTGQVTKFEGFDDFIKKVAGDNEAVAKALRSMGSEELYRQGVTQTFGFLPVKGVTKGDKWKQTGNMPLPLFGALKSETEFAYQGPGEKGEQIAFTQQFTYELPKPQDGALLRITKADVKIEPGKGLFIFDARAGRLVRLERSFKLKGTFTSEVGGKERTIDLEQESTVVSHVLSDNPLK